jgi:epoxyqueuosine reductase
MTAQRYSSLIRAEAQRLGFSFVGMARAERMDEEARRLETWLNQGKHGKMGYMENHFEKRIDPRKLVEGAKSVVTLLYNYHTVEKQADDALPKIASYAFGEDYHHVLKSKLKELLVYIQTEIGEVSGRCFVDSAPVLERDWARRSGVGWMGKNTLIIHPKQGSYFFVAELIIDLDLVYDAPIKDYCGTCTRCIDACPTEAISPEGYIVDGSKCISYLTIELREAIPVEFKGKMEGWAFGCDICQQVCPWNRFAVTHNEPKFLANPEILTLSKEEWLEMTEEVFGALFKQSAIKRTKLEGMKRNVGFSGEGYD